VLSGDNIFGDGALHALSAPEAADRGIYVTSFAFTELGVPGYSSGNRKNKPPICMTPFSARTENDVAVDGVGNVMIPDNADKSLFIGAGPGMCGAQAGTITDPYGEPADASSANALTGRIAVLNPLDNLSKAGSISVCTLSGGCTHNLKNVNMFRLNGVAMDNSGNCWASALLKTGVATLTYFKGCAGKGVAATGFQNVSPGGLDIDSSGNLVSIDGEFASNGPGQVWVYSGCNPACTLVGGPFPLIGQSAFGHLNHLGNRFATADSQHNQIDVYSYSPTSITFLYSFNNGIPQNGTVEGVAYNPRSSQ